MLYTVKQAGSIICNEKANVVCCLGPKCAAWRWAPFNKQARGEPTGYCGKAGPVVADNPGQYPPGFNYSENQWHEDMKKKGGTSAE